MIYAVRSDAILKKKKEKILFSAAVEDRKVEKEKEMKGYKETQEVGDRERGEMRQRLLFDVCCWC